MAILPGQRFLAVLGARLGACCAAASLRSGVFAAALGAVVLLPGVARAQIGSERYSSIVMDSASGSVLSAVSADEPRYPASLTKMMTLYMLFEALRDHRVALDELVPVSAHAASMSPTKLGLTPSTRISVQEAILGLVTLSANDAAAALGELMGGDEDRFAEMMTLRARALGMRNTTFRNASGLPDPEQISTARDMGMLARHLIQDFPEYYAYFSTPSFVFHGRTILNHDHMLQSYPGADGMKTGYTHLSGLNLVTSAVHGDTRLIGVIFGASNGVERDIHMASLLDAGFEKEDVPLVPRRGAPLMARLPSMIGSAEAATMPTPVAMQAAAHARLAPVRSPQQPHWAVALGSFPTEVAARRAAMAHRDVGDVRLDPEVVRGRAVAWRVSLTGLTQAEAVGVCAHSRGVCSIIRPDPNQLASR